MALTNTFYKMVKEGNVLNVRIMMKDSLLVDRTFTDFNNMEKASGSMVGLYDKHDGREFIPDAAQWNDDYMNKLMVQVVNNFSHERIDHLKEVVKYLRPVAKAEQSSHPSSATNNMRQTHSSTSGSAYQNQKYRDQSNGNYREVKIAAGAVAGAVVGGVVASIAGITVVGSIVTGAVIGGAAVTITSKGGK